MASRHCGKLFIIIQVIENRKHNPAQETSACVLAELVVLLSSFFGFQLGRYTCHADLFLHLKTENFGDIRCCSLPTQETLT